MASAFAPVPGSLHSQDRDQLQRPEPRNPSSPASNLQPLSASAVDVDSLSLIHRESLSPPVNQFETPGGSTTSLGNYQSSDFSDLDEDPFFGADFSNVEGGTPSFLDVAPGWDQPAFLTSDSEVVKPRHEVDDGTSYPLTPSHTASVHTTSPRSEGKDTITQPIADWLPDSISPEQLQKPFKPAPVTVESFDGAPSHSSSGQTSEDGLALPSVAMKPLSPRVTVSIWDQDDRAPVHTIERTFEDSSNTVRGGIHSAGDLISSAHDDDFASAHRASLDRWHSESAARRGGLDPVQRPVDEVPSINEATNQRNIDDRNQDVGNWLSGNFDDIPAPREKSAEEIQALEQAGYDSNDGIPLGDATENRFIPGQTYYNESNSGQMNAIDRDIIAANRNWADAPVLHQITLGAPGRNQPQSSQAAIEKFERLCRDNDSIISRSATWGTRRRSHPSVLDLDTEGVTSGSFLKKLSLSRGSGDKGHKSGGLLRDLRGLVRRPSASSMRKRSRSRSRSYGTKDAEAPYQQDDDQPIKRESTPHLSPTSRTSSWGKKPSTPSINTALVNMAQHMASIGTTHSRSGSISGTPPIVSPRNSLTSSLSVRNTLRRPRSKSEIPKPSAAAVPESHSNLVEMWKKSGGPPVASLTTTSNMPVEEDDDDDDDDLCEDGDMKANPNIIDEFAPNFAGFQQHVVTLNPGLGSSYGYLVDRIAHQQIIRYKHLLNSKVKHLGLGANCPCGSLCIALGGTAHILDQKGDPRGADPLSTHLDDPDEDTPTEGVISQESFPQDIPMPPTQYLPAEFECQLCYQRKKFQKPSDWTKHVHEDVQPFTCTWDKCRDPKIFKRKADWVRHENEGHRHLEWWTCDVDDCRHTCYRRDNFLQHLVREHKFLEPKVKTKAAMKRAGGMDPTWQKVEQCHKETSTRPQEEPCRFCGKVFPTWKKLTVHLAKHMEQISLPVLRLVAAKAKELAADTIISPVQDPPPRPMIPPSNQTSPATQYPGIAMQQQQQHHLQPGRQHIGYPSHGQFVYQTMLPQRQHQQHQQQQQQQQFYSPQYNNIGQSLQQPGLGVSAINQGYDPNQRLQGLSNSSEAFATGPPSYMSMNNEVEPFPELDALGLQSLGGGQMGGQMGYDAMMDPSSVNGSPFSGHESLSTYSHSPHLNATSNNNNNNQEQPWEERRLTGFL